MRKFQRKLNLSAAIYDSYYPAISIMSIGYTSNVFNFFENPNNLGGQFTPDGRPLFLNPLPMVNQLFHWYFLEELSACHMLLTKKMYNNQDHLLLSENKHLVLSFGKAIGRRNIKSRFPHICHPCKVLVSPRMSILFSFKARKSDPNQPKTGQITTV